MVSAFCPGHITCFFTPAGDLSADLLSRGSLGAGIRTSLGAFADVHERSGTRTVMDGSETDLPVTSRVLELLAPGRGFDVSVENGLPCGEGFGMSAAGAVAVALAVADICGIGKQEAFEAAHKAEILGGGGLGDVSALYCLGHQPVRVKEGIPPYGEVIPTGVEFKQLTLAVLGPKMHTGSVLSDPVRVSAISNAGRRAVKEYLVKPDLGKLYGLSNRFSVEAGVECAEVSDALSKLHAEGYRAAMCMLGNSIFTDAPETEAESLLGPGANIFSCSSTDKSAGITHRV